MGAGDDGGELLGGVAGGGEGVCGVCGGEGGGEGSVYWDGGGEGEYDCKGLGRVGVVVVETRGWGLSCRGGLVGSFCSCVEKRAMGGLRALVVG